MTLKRDNWTNDEVIALLQSRRVESCPEYNEVIEQCIILFREMRANQNTCFSAKALDTDTGRIVAVGPKLPQ